MDADSLSFINLLKIFTETYSVAGAVLSAGDSMLRLSLGQRWKHTQITAIQCDKCFNVGTV